LIQPRTWEDRGEILNVVFGSTSRDESLTKRKCKYIFFILVMFKITLNIKALKI